MSIWLRAGIRSYNEYLTIGRDKACRDYDPYTVLRRDTIVTRGEARAKLNKKVVTKGKFQRQLAELRKKIKSAIAVGATQNVPNCVYGCRQNKGCLYLIPPTINVLDN